MAGRYTVCELRKRCWEKSMSITPEISELTGGLRVVTTSMASAQSVSVSVFVGAGSRGEAERTKGLAHFLEHMMFKGTPKRPSAIDVAEAIEGAGGVLERRIRWPPCHRATSANGSPSGTERRTSWSVSPETPPLTASMHWW